MKRSEAIRSLVEYAETDALIVANLGFPSRELYAIADRPGNFYMLGSMGLASSIGLGCALFTRKKVYVIDGDGSILMNAGALATVAHHGPDNLCLVIVDNAAYGSTGGQPTYTGGKTDLAAMARAAGNRHVVRVKTVSALRRALHRLRGVASVIIAKTDAENDEVPIIPLSPSEIKKRFQNYASAFSDKREER